MSLPGFETSDGTKFEENYKALLHERVWKGSFGREKLNTKNVNRYVLFRAKLLGANTHETSLFGDKAVITTYKDVRYYKEEIEQSSQFITLAAKQGTLLRVPEPLKYPTNM